MRSNISSNGLCRLVKSEILELLDFQFGHQESSAILEIGGTYE